MAAKQISDEQREEWRKKGYTLPDGSYPIPNKEFLDRAMRSFGRAPEGHRAALRRHIQKRAKALGVDISDSAIVAASLTDSVDYYEQDDPMAQVFPLTAASFPVKPPAHWFDDPGLTGPTPLTVTADGQVYGHIAPWNSRHVGLPGNVRPPKSRSNYAYFNKGVLETDGGADVTVGQLTLAGGHAPLHADASRAVQHYDDTNSAVADIHVGEDKYGIWAAGAVRPDVDEVKLRALRASVPSGDWRPINGALELVAVCQVNSGGFPVARTAIAASSGQVLALVAAGAQDLYGLRLDGILNGDLHQRIDDLEAVVAALRSEHTTQLRKRVHG